jgi:predicted metal-dependent phosphoesterase TrpH
VRAVTHIHTKFSWDSLMSVRALARALHHGGIDLALVTDHDSFEGALALRRITRAEGLGFVAPIAAEIRTDLGDVIFVLEDGDPPPVAALKKWSELRRAARDVGALVWLPHPYRSHVQIETLADEADVVEIFNSRCTDRENAMAFELCRRFEKVPALAADSHRLREARRWSVEYERAEGALRTLRNPAQCDEPKHARQSDVSLAEIVNGFTKRRPTLIGWFTARYALSRGRELAGRGDRWRRR